MKQQKFMKTFGGILLVKRLQDQSDIQFIAQKDLDAASQQLVAAKTLTQKLKKQLKILMQTFKQNKSEADARAE